MLGLAIKACYSSIKACYSLIRNYFFYCGLIVHYYWNKKNSHLGTKRFPPWDKNVPKGGNFLNLA
jgi:hypothetical protein